MNKSAYVNLTENCQTVFLKKLRFLFSFKVTFDLNVILQQIFIVQTNKTSNDGTKYNSIKSSCQQST